MASWTRRAFLGAAAAAAAASAGAVAAVELDRSARSPAGARPRAAKRPAASRTTAAENALPGTNSWWISTLGAPDEIVGYAGQASVLPGERVSLYVSTTAREYQVRAFRIGWYGGDLARQVWQSGAIRGYQQAAAGFAESTRTVSTQWNVSLTVPTDDWPPGSYLFRLDAETGGQRYVPLTVRSATTAGKVVIKNAVPTWQAYNTWGGYDLYVGPSGGYDDRSYVVSLDRPGDYDGAYLFQVYERKLVNLAERLGLPLAYLTSMDIASNPRSLDGASALVSPGHDEYWSPSERTVVTAARDAGMNIAFLGANAMFRRTRLQPSPLGDSREVVCYKTSYQLDPLYGVQNDLVTSDWREPPNPDPESSLIGTLYEGYPAIADYVVLTPDAWLFKGTGVSAGTSFPVLVGIEYDRVTPGFPMERPIQVLAHSPLTCNGVASFADSAYYTHPGGAGVFNTGTMRWVEAFGPPTYGWGLTTAAGQFTRRVTANVLTAFADGPAAAKYPAQDNLAAVDEQVGDPLGPGVAIGQ
ncbi:MAG TPA: N,N-dimethylformamidase beta subunit family domain-containing protein [Streptosporangiaceae bacterium]|nr:N,N-dimethylformamidase beta subunit family domain-containing protein [Streptosporangiaceae bacterium]